MRLSKAKYIVKQIIQNHWIEFEHTHEIITIEKEEVEKMLACKDIKRDYFLYQCMDCGTQHNLFLFCFYFLFLNQNNL
jgi:hypothetical protein